MHLWRTRGQQPVPTPPNPWPTIPPRPIVVVPFATIGQDADTALSRAHILKRAKNAAEVFAVHVCTDNVAQETRTYLEAWGNRYRHTSLVLLAASQELQATAIAEYVDQRHRPVHVLLDSTALGDSGLAAEIADELSMSTEANVTLIPAELPQHRETM